MNKPLDFINIVEPNGRMSYFSIHGNQVKRNEMLSVGGGLEHGTVFEPASRLDAFKLIAWLEEWIAQDIFKNEIRQVNAAHEKKIEIAKKER